MSLLKPEFFCMGAAFFEQIISGYKFADWCLGFRQHLPTCFKGGGKKCREECTGAAPVDGLHRACLSPSQVCSWGATFPTPRLMELAKAQIQLLQPNSISCRMQQYDLPASLPPSKQGKASQSISVKTRVALSDFTCLESPAPIWSGPQSRNHRMVWDFNIF